MAINKIRVNGTDYDIGANAKNVRFDSVAFPMAEMDNQNKLDTGVLDALDTKAEFQRYSNEYIYNVVNDTNQEGEKKPTTQENYGTDEVKVGLRSISFGQTCRAGGSYSIAVGAGCETFAEDSQAFGRNCISYSDGAMARGLECIATGGGAFASGASSTASGDGAHAEGNNCWAMATAAHAEGLNTQAYNAGAHTEGGYCEAGGLFSHAGGYKSKTTTDYSFVHGEGLDSQTYYNQFVIGKYNRLTSDLFVIGNGTDKERHNAFTVTQAGNTHINGDATVYGNLEVKGSLKFDFIKTYSSGLTYYTGAWGTIPPGQYYVEGGQYNSNTSTRNPRLNVYNLKAKIKIPNEVKNIYQVYLKLYWESTWTFVPAQQFTRYGNELEGYFASTAPEGAFPAIFGNDPVPANVYMEILYTI